MKRILFNLRNRYFFFFDFLIFMVIPFVAVMIRFDGFSYPTSNVAILTYGFTFSLLKISILFLMGVYAIYWYHASIDDLLTLLYSGVNILLVQFFLLIILKHFHMVGFAEIPRSIPILDAVFSVLLLSLSRLGPRMVLRTTQRISQYSQGKTENVLIVGAGMAGIMALDELLRKRDSRQKVVGFVDDDPKKIGMKIRGFRVLGNRHAIPKLVQERDIQKILIAIPSASGRALKGIIDICNSLEEVEILTLPPLYDIIDGRVEIGKFRKIQIEDLLRREPIKTDLEGIASLIKNRRVLVTGAGGSIGSEICRQVLRCQPKHLYLLGHGENSIFELEHELAATFDRNKLTAVIADITDIQNLRNIFRQEKVDFIFHAAAHKHVPLMERYPYEAVRNNVLGTKNLVHVAVEAGVKKLIMISTDKAVNPTSIMGASKRVAEMVVIQAAKEFRRKFSVVRFGNVLGSRGSVIRIFRRQIEKGGPITLTHPDIKRYFMTIPEAVQLVLQAFMLGNGGDVFVLDMGEPVRIMDLAEDMIRLSGLRLGEDIEIKVTGLRPGEKLFEELFIPGENYRRTINEKIFIAENASHFITPDFEEKLNDLLQLLYSETNGTSLFRERLKTLVPEFLPVSREG